MSRWLTSSERVPEFLRGAIRADLVESVMVRAGSIEPTMPLEPADDAGGQGQELETVEILPGLRAVTGVKPTRQGLPVWFVVAAAVGPGASIVTLDMHESSIDAAAALAALVNGGGL